MKVSLKRMRSMLTDNTAAKAVALTLAVSLACPPQLGYALNPHDETPTKAKNRGGGKQC
jgi:hypothetical protein